MYPSITKNSDPFAVAGRNYNFGAAAQEGPLKILGDMVIKQPILNKNLFAGIDFEDAVCEHPSPLGFGSISPLFARFVHLSNNPVTFFSFENDRLDCKVTFLGADPLTIRVNEPVSNIILKELEGGDVSLTESKIHITKSTPFALETGQSVDCKTERSFGPL
ncbi:MAG: hypothetical protein ACRCUQ_05125 [Alphaproteobacteria bacterium]